MRETLLLERTVVPALRSVAPVERLVVEPVLRLVRVFWSAEPVERLVEVPVLRLVVAEELLPVLRLVVAEEELPVERLVVLLPVERLVRSF